jgi:hypothetical protein
MEEVRRECHATTDLHEKGKFGQRGAGPAEKGLCLSESGRVPNERKLEQRLIADLEGSLFPR